MEIQFLASNPLVREDAGRVAVKRGPVVYCMEEADNGKNLHLTKLCVNGEKTAEAADELGEHFVRVTAEGRRMKPVSYTHLIYAGERSFYTGKWNFFSGKRSF